MRVMHRMFHFGRFNVKPPADTVRVIPGTPLPKDAERKDKRTPDDMVLRSLPYFSAVHA